MSDPKAASDRPASCKELIEHIRTVHFALTIACATLLIVLLAPKLDMTRAAIQANQIQGLADRWNEVQTALWNSAVARSKFPAPLEWQDVISVTDLNCRPTATRDCVLLHGIVAVDEPLMRGASSWPALAGGLERRPVTLTEFRKWWDRLHTDATVGLPDFSSIKEIDALHINELQTAISRVQVMTAKMYVPKGESPNADRPNILTPEGQELLPTTFTVARDDRFKIAS